MYVLILVVLSLNRSSHLIVDGVEFLLLVRVCLAGVSGLTAVSRTLLVLRSALGVVVARGLFSFGVQKLVDLDD